MTVSGDNRPDLVSVPHETLVLMRAAASEILTCQHALAKTGHSVVTEMTGGHHAQVEDWLHYPAGDVYDAEHHAQFYFHVHPSDERDGTELGHFHLFLRREAIPPSVEPLSQSADGLCHLIAISVDSAGRPIRLFTTNRWVTGEAWYGASDVADMLGGFVVDHAQPSWPVNRWVTAMVRLYQPEIGWLLALRDRSFARLKAHRSTADIFEDRSVEILSSLAIDIADRIDSLDTALRRQRRISPPAAP